MPHTYTAPILSYDMLFFFWDRYDFFFLKLQRKGTAVAGVGFVWASVMTVIFLYWQTLPLAGVCVCVCVLGWCVCVCVL
jgi:hypothetical protein